MIIFNEVAVFFEGNSSKIEDRVHNESYQWGELAFVADGVGGCSGGEEAAQLAMDKTFQWASSLDYAPSSQQCAGWLEQLDQILAKEPQTGLTTAVLVVFSGSALTGASVGDSSAWLFTQNDEIELTKLQSRKPMLGSGNATPTSFESPGETGKLMLASDGLTKYVDWSLVGPLVREKPSPVAALTLIEKVRLPSGGFHDDVAILIAHLD